MTRTIPYMLEDYPAEAALVGRILLAYGDLETNCLELVSVAAKLTLSTAARVLYRLRSEANRLAVSDAILRPFFEEHNLAGAYAQWYGAMKHCKKIRNQYAHCMWDAREQWGLVFADLDEAASGTKAGAVLIEYRPINVALLEEQEAFFHYTEDVTLYLNNEAIFRRDRRKRHKRQLPKASKLPRLDNRPKV